MTNGTHRGRIAALVAAVVVIAAGVATAAPWTAPDDWTEVGTVAEWRDADARFFRQRATAAQLDRSRDHLDQRAIYDRTRTFRGTLDGIGLAAWDRLDGDERQARREAARRELRFVVAFRERIANEVHNSRAGTATAWGTRVSDATVVGDLLGRLGTAVALDPSNPYVWHLYSYFASVAGDVNRALQACRGAEAALAGIPAGELPDLRASLALDKAWLLRGQGEFAAARASLEQAAGLGAARLEARLLQGLLAAQMGNDQVAIAVATELRAMPVAAFPRDARSTGFGPELTNVEAWSRRPSTYLHDWIMAYTWLRAGRADLAAVAFGVQNFDDQRPFAHRFWNEAGMIYAATGRQGLAATAWSQARVCAPWYPYLVSTDHARSLAGLTGRSGAVPYQLGYDTYFISGSRLAFAADLVERVAGTYDEHERRTLASRALDQLEICRRFGLFAGQAAVLQGQVFYLMNDTASALVEVEEALAHLDAVGDRAGFAAVLAGLVRSRDELAPQDIARFYGQSGRSRGRWAGDEDPDATLAGLRAAFAADPGDGPRRDLARFLIRNEAPAEGRALALLPLGDVAPDRRNIVSLAAADLELVLEADRARGDVALAALVVQTLQGGDDPWASPGVWALAGFICLDGDQRAAGRSALERAVELDPGNHGLKIQLSLM